MQKKQIIKSNFSRHAVHYNKYATVQQKVIEALLLKLPVNAVNILELGCGPANYTKLLYEKYLNAHIYAVDISDSMIAVAQTNIHHPNIKFSIEDAEVMPLESKYDLITSNATFQWFEDLPASIKRFSNALNDKGNLIFSIFGQNTFIELKKIMNLVVGQDIILTSSNFSTKQEIESILKNNFSKVLVEEQNINATYKSLLELLKKIKYTGTRGKQSTSLNFTKKLIKELEKVYLKEFETIQATYQIFICKAEK